MLSVEAPVLFIFLYLKWKCNETEKKGTWKTTEVKKDTL